MPVTGAGLRPAAARRVRQGLPGPLPAAGRVPCAAHRLAWAGQRRGALKMGGRGGVWAVDTHSEDKGGSQEHDSEGRQTGAESMKASIWPRHISLRRPGAFVLVW